MRLTLVSHITSITLIRPRHRFGESNQKHQRNNAKWDFIEWSEGKTKKRKNIVSWYDLLRMLMRLTRLTRHVITCATAAAAVCLAQTEKWITSGYNVSQYVEIKVIKIIRHNNTLSMPSCAGANLLAIRTTVDAKRTLNASQCALWKRCTSNTVQPNWRRLFSDDLHTIVFGFVRAKCCLNVTKVIANLLQSLIRVIQFIYKANEWPICCPFCGNNIPLGQ